MYKLYYKQGTGVVVVQAILEECSVAYEKIVVADSKSPAFPGLEPHGGYSRA